MGKRPPVSPNDVVVMAFEPTGLTKDVARLVAKAIDGKLKAQTPGKTFRLRSVRFVPSTKAQTPDGFQVVANTTIETGGSNSVASSFNLESVATIKVSNGVNTVADVKLPSLLSSQ